MELASDILVLVGALIVIGGLGWIWWPLGIVALGAAMIAMGWIFAVKAVRSKALKGKEKG